MTPYKQIKAGAKAAALEYERANLQAWLDAHDGSITHTARALGCSYALLQYATTKHATIDCNHRRGRPRTEEV